MRFIRPRVVIGLLVVAGIVLAAGLDLPGQGVAVLGGSAYAFFRYQMQRAAEEARA